MSGIPILIAGPTASGKSALAMTLARTLGGVVVNADSQQVYAGWRILTARPSAEDEATVPHRLYGHVPMTETCSVGRWLDDVGAVLAKACQRPIIVGGTGLYFRALTQGLAPIPDVPAEIRAEAEARLAREGLANLADDLARRDARTTATLDMNNPRRVVRAWEVLAATGTGLAEWRTRTPAPLVAPSRAVRVALIPPRARLYARGDARLDWMIGAGALDEVTRVMALGLPRTAPAMKAVGAAEFAAHLDGRVSLDEAVMQAKTATRRYAKRQMTWIRNQMAGWQWLDPADPDLAGHALALARDDARGEGGALPG